MNLYKRRKGGTLKIGDGFCCHNSCECNSIGLMQPTLSNIGEPGCQLTIGENVGISTLVIRINWEVSIWCNGIIE